MPQSIISLISTADVTDLQAILGLTELFPAEYLPQLLDPFFADETEAIWLTSRIDGTAVGFCYLEPEELAQGTWNMRAIAVHPDFQRMGIGKALVQKSEDTLRESGQRILIVDTPGTEDFAATRLFYTRNNYELEAQIRDFWAKGDDKVIFRKAL